MISFQCQTQFIFRWALHTLLLCLVQVDEPSAYLDSEQRIAAAKVIKRFIMHSKKTAFIVEHDFIMATYLADRLWTKELPSILSQRVPLVKYFFVQSDRVWRSSGRGDHSSFSPGFSSQFHHIIVIFDSLSLSRLWFRAWTCSWSSWTSLSGETRRTSDRVSTRWTLSRTESKRSLETTSS